MIINYRKWYIILKLTCIIKTVYLDLYYDFEIQVKYKIMLKEEIKKKCLEDADLFADLCATTGKIPNACLQFLNRNSSIELRSYEVLQVIKKHTGLTEEDILNPINQSIWNMH